MEIYEPGEDSYLLKESLIEFLDEKNKDIHILDMGSGSGIQGESCKSLGFSNVIAAEINKYALKQLKLKGFETIESDLFKSLKGKKFDLIIFNPPYLPIDKLEPKNSKLATSGGRKGYELIVRFLKEAKNHLNKDGNILLLFSSLSKPNVIIKNIRELGYSLKLKNKKKLFFEELYVYQIY